MKKLFFLTALTVLLGLSLVSTTVAQAPGDSLWTLCYGENDTDYGNDVCLTSDGGYAVAGGTYSFGANNGDAILVKTDADGEVLWTQLYGGDSGDDASAVQRTADDGYIIAVKRDLVTNFKA